jgi:two-component system cell cycle sensor histidine kinase/response regulator CckA
VRENLVEIQSAADMATSLSRQLLYVNRKPVAPTTAVDLNDVVRRMHKMLRRLLGNDTKFLVHQRCEGAYVRANVNEIEQLVLNLVVNARDGMPTGGTLTMETSLTLLNDAPFLQVNGKLTAGEFVTLTVTDTGVGMTSNVRAQIFVPFFTTKKMGKGTGLGLTAVHNIVQEAGGCIVVDSAPNQGTTFTIHLPKAVDADAGARRSDVIR